jgi:pilus assembly protein CpaF
MNRDLELLLSFMEPIRELLLDDTVSEIMGNPDGTWWCQRQGTITRAEGIRFDDKALRMALTVTANKLGKRFDTENPLLDAQLPDGSRLAAVMPPIVKPCASVTIRKFSRVRLTLDDLIRGRTLPHKLAQFLILQIEAGKTVLFSGGTDSGKTTLLNALTDSIPNEERLVVIEDTRELRIEKPNILAAECRKNAEQGRIDFDTLLKASLRWRPDRIILGEVRGEEARTLLDSFNTGHAGSMATIHASSAVLALDRFSELAMRSHQQAMRDDLCAEIAKAVHMVIHTQKFKQQRRVSEVIVVRGYDRRMKAFEFDTVYDAAHEAESAESEAIHAA